MRTEDSIILLAARAQLAPEFSKDIAYCLQHTLDWPYLLRQAEFHGLLPILAHHLMGNGLSDFIPQPHLIELKNARDYGLYRDLLLGHELEKVLIHFNEWGIQAVPLKGPVLGEAIYGHPGLRPASDLDILVVPGQLGAAGHALAELGYRRAASRQATHPFHDVYYLKNDGISVVVELHWALGDGRLAAFDHQVIWNRIRTVSFNGLQVLCLSPEDNLIYLSQHLPKHDIGLLKLLCDIGCLLRQYGGNMDWTYIEVAARDWHLRTSIYYSLERAHTLLGAPVPEDFLDSIKQTRFRWCLINLLIPESNFVEPLKGRRLRGESFSLARCLMMDKLRLIPVAYTSYICSGRRWSSTEIWWRRVVAVVMAGGLSSLAVLYSLCRNWKALLKLRVRPAK